MKNVLRWIVLVWTVIAIPYVFVEDFVETFFGLIYAGLIIGLVISDLRSKDKN